jgi:agmatine deiminase
VTRWPAEWEPHEQTVMCWPVRTDLWGDEFEAAERAHRDVAGAIARYEPVTMLAPARTSERAAAMCGPGIDVVELEIDDSWFRDSGPIYVWDDAGHRVATDWIFNSWGEKFHPFGADARAAAAFAELSSHPTRSIDMVFEGGSVTGDGDGTIVTTTQCLMHPNRNPSMTQAEIDAQIRAELGADVVIWLPHGLALDDDTDGHVDNIAAFAAPGHLVLQGCSDRAEDDWLRLDVRCSRSPRWRGSASWSRTSTTTSAMASSSCRRVAIRPTPTWWR